MSQSQDEIIAIIMNFSGHKKWIKIHKTVSYEECVTLAKKKFCIEENKEIFFQDSTGTDVDEDFLPYFLSNINETNLQLYIYLEGTNIVTLNLTEKDDDASSVSTLTLSNNSFESIIENINDDVSFASTSSGSSPLIFNEISSIEEENSQELEKIAFDLNSSERAEEIFKKPFVLKKSINITSRQLEALMKAKGHSQLIGSCKKTIISNEIRRKLVNVVANIFVERHGFDNSKTLRAQYAEAIVNLFPNFKNPFSTSGGYEQFYDPATSSGFLAWRLRYLYQKSEENLQKKQQKKIFASRKRSLETDTDTSEKQEIEPKEKKNKNAETEENISFLMNACPRSQRKSIFEKTQETFSYRRNIESITFEEFPRFFDTPGLIELEFSLLHPNAEDFKKKFPQYVERLLTIYALTEKSPLEHVTGVNKNLTVFDKTTRAVLSVLYMLPPTAKGRKKGCREALATVADRLIYFKLSNVPLESIIHNRKTKQPLIIASGANLAAIDAYYIILDNKIIDVGLNNILNAIDLLFKVHFTFNVKYDEPLKTFWEFLETFFYNINTNNVKYTSKMLELRTRLTNVALD